MINTSKNFFAIDFVNKTITGSKANFSRAGKGMGAEYEELMTKMAAHPGYRLVEKKQKANRTKKTYHGLNFKFMETYISIQSNKDDLMARYEKAKEMARTCEKKVYPLVKEWFLNEFKAFDMEQAIEEIKGYRLDIINAVSDEIPEEENVFDPVIVTNAEQNSEMAS